MDPSIPDPNLFLKYDYPETRELLKSFLTLVSATLVLSVAFSEKIAKTHEADDWVRKLMFSAWALFFISIVLGGMAIVFIAGSAGCAIYGAIPLVTCGGWILANVAWAIGLIGGSTYASGLVCIVLAARRAILLDIR